MKKIIVPTGYMGSGSSAITDLISEFRDCQNEFKSYEYVLLHCPNGLFDFEDKLLIGNNAIRSDEAIRSFETQMKKLYNKKFWWVGNYQKIISSNFMKITEEYINNIQHSTYSQRRFYQRKCDLKQFLPVICSINSCSFIIRVINALQTGKYTEGNEWHGNKDTYKNFPCKICTRGRSPVYRAGDQTDFH